MLLNNLCERNPFPTCVTSKLNLCSPTDKMPKDISWSPAGKLLIHLTLPSTSILKLNLKDVSS